MIDNDKNYYNWSIESILEIELKEPDDFLKIKETLTRMGIASKRDNTLYQTAHILHKRGRYYLVHFKELFALDGRPSDLSHDDVSRRNLIASLLEQWTLCKVTKTEEYAILKAPISAIKIVPFREKREWNLVQKYSMRSDRRIQ